MSEDQALGQPATAASVERSLEAAAVRLERASAFAKPSHTTRILELGRRLLLQDGGIERLYQWAPRLDAAGVFAGTDWDSPASLIAGLVKGTLEHGDRVTISVECINLLRMLAISKGIAQRPGFSAEQALHYLTQVLAHNLDRVFAADNSEVARLRRSEMSPAIDSLFHFLVAEVGYENILGSLSDEIWRVLGQRPIQVHHIKAMVTQIAVTLSSGEAQIGDARLGADRLISALFGPTRASQDDPGIDGYRERLSAMDRAALLEEAVGFSRAMHDVGLVSDYHAVFLRWLREHNKDNLLADALGLSNTGRDSLLCYPQLVNALIDQAIHVETAQSVYGLALLLERGILYTPSIAPGLWRQIAMPLSPQSEATLSMVFGPSRPPNIFLLAGVISLLGQPLGVGQGNNPTCQSARAISMWSLSDPDYLLHLVAQAARFDNIQLHFEGQAIDSAHLPIGLVHGAPIDNDPVSNLLVPHLDRIYAEMGRRCADRGEDPHCWINPEFHGWWVGREFAIAVEAETGKLCDFDGFLRRFFASYHPLYNNNQPVIHPQPAGLAMTDSAGRFVGWHAISLLRVALDQQGDMRVYFYNPNNDSGQNWGHGVVVSTQGHGERFGESSLLFSELASRLYIFHDEPLAVPPLDAVPAQDVATAREMALASWAAGRDASSLEDCLP